MTDERVLEVEAERDELAERLSATLGQLADATVTHSDLEVRLAAATDADNTDRVVELLAELAPAQAEMEEMSPTRDVSLYLMSTEEQVRERFGDQALVDLANAERIRENRERNARGDFPLPRLEGEELDASIAAAITDLLGDRHREMPPTEGPLDRCLKMVAPDGSLRQIPYEPQINNMAGSLADGYERYRLKGFKMTRPTLCPSKNCNLESSVDGDGEYSYRAYCSSDHENRTERDDQTNVVSGVSTRNVVKTAY